MKYLLILLFLFSNHSFSGELDGKAIYCKLKIIHKYNNKINCENNRADYSCAPLKKTILYGFNWGKVYIPYLDDSNELKPKVKFFKNEYKLKPTVINFGIYSLNRKNLELYERTTAELKKPTFDDIINNPFLKKFTYQCEIRKFSKKEMRSMFQSDIKKILNKQKGNKI
jgi:hypothetical protein